MRHRINSPQVVNETIQGEAIVIHLGTGTYYSLQGTGAAIWDAVERGQNLAEIVDGLVARYDGARDQIEGAVSSLLDELVAEDLLVPLEPGVNGSTPRIGSIPSVERVAFIAPSLEKYTDMQEIILLDPVHEVDVRGWPHERAAGL
jgi:hypothetical protein